jgi:D-arginine dehydrogenase
VSTLFDSDVIVIGAGIAGTSVAYFLSPHVSVRVLERESQPGFHSTGRSAALFSETYGPPQVQTLTRASRGFLEDPPPGFTQSELLAPRGAMIIGTREQRALIEGAFSAAAPFLPDLCLLQTPSLRDIVPVLEPRFASLGMFEPRAADIDVNGVHQGFIRGLKSRGAELTCGVDIGSIERVQGRWVLDAGERVFRAPLLIDAAGAWADEVARMAGVPILGLEPRRRSAFVFAPPEGIATAQWPFVASAEEGFYFKPDAGLLLGSPANADPVDPHDVQPEELDIALAIHRIEEATTMRIARPIRSWAGLRTFVADGNVVSGFAPDAPDFFWLAALGGYGIQTCAALGEASAHLALRRALPSHLTDVGITPDLLAMRRDRVTVHT